MRWTMMAVAAGAIMQGGASGAQRPPVNSATLDSEKLVCKSHIETGSLVRAKKRCFAKKDWARIIDTEQRGARRMAEELAERSQTN